MKPLERVLSIVANEKKKTLEMAKEDIYGLNDLEDL